MIWSASSAITPKGAREEINARGVANVSLVTHKIANGTASFGDKIGIVLTTVIGAFFSPMWLIAASIIGTILYLIFHMWLGITK